MVLMRFHTIALILTVCIFPIPATAQVRSDEITVVFRYDDPSAKSDINLERSVIEAFRRHDMGCTFGVIPFVCAGDVHDSGHQEYLPLQGDIAEMLASAAREGILEIAQHGYSHQANAPVHGTYSEFAHLDYDDQVGWIEAGKRLLEDELGIEVITFVPPWNTYDANTLVALEQLNFSCLSAANGGVLDTAGTLRFLPATSNLSQIQGAISAARDLPDPAPVIVVLFHGYDFARSGGSDGAPVLNDLDNILAWLAVQDDVVVRSMQEVEGADVLRYSANLSLRRLQGLLPGRLRIPSHQHIYFSMEGVQRLRQLSIIRLLVFYGGLVLLAVLASLAGSSLMLARIPRRIWRLVLLLGYMLLCGGLLMVFRDRQVGWREAVAVTGVFGWCVGSSLVNVLIRRWACLAPPVSDQGERGKLEDVL